MNISTDFNTTNNITGLSLVGKEIYIIIKDMLLIYDTNE